MGKGGSIMRVFLLLILISVLVLGGLLWFDYLGLVHTRGMFSPIYSMFGKKTPKGVATSSEELADLENDRYAKRVQALEINKEELDKLRSEVEAEKKENLKIAEELNDRKTSIEEKEKSFQQIMQETDDRNRNIIQIANYMNGMRPANAVANLLEMDDQDIIDVLRATENIAIKDGKTSLVSYWFSLMPPARAAQIQRKMANKPVKLKE